MRIRRRLIAIMIVLVALGLVAVDVVTPHAVLELMPALTVGVFA